MGIHNRAEAFIEEFGKKIIEKVKLPPHPSYWIKRQYLSFDEGSEEVHHFIDFRMEDSEKIITLKVPPIPGESGGPFFWNGDEEDVVRRIVANSNLSAEEVRSRLYSLEASESRSSEDGLNRWERYLMQIASDFESDDALPEEAEALRAIVRSRINNERMFRGALVAVLNREAEDVQKDVDKVLEKPVKKEGG